MLFEPRVNFNFFTHLRFKKSWSTSKKRKSPGGLSEPPPNHDHHHHHRSFRATSFNPPRHDWRHHFLEPWTCEQPKRKTKPPSGFYLVIRFLAHHRKNPQWNLRGKTNTSSKKKRSILPGAMGFVVQNECLSTKVWERPVLPVVICQSQYLAASKFLMCSTSQLPLKNSSRQKILAKIRVHQPSLSFAQEGFLPGYWSPSENPTTKRPNPTSELCVDEEQSTSEAHAKASIRFFMEFPTPWKINIKQTKK